MMGSLGADRPRDIPKLDTAPVSSRDQGVYIHSPFLRSLASCVLMGMGDSLAYHVILRG